MIINETNRYAQQFFEDSPNLATNTYYRVWVPCYSSKITLIIHMGLSQFPRLEYHWFKSILYNCTLCPSIMSKQEFFLLHRFLHFSDNKSANLDDKLYKLRRLFELLTLRFRRFYIPRRELSIDERMIKYTGRLSFLQFIRNKPNQFGIKVFILADSFTG